jgi:hypothetical protein
MTERISGGANFSIAMGETHGKDDFINMDFPTPTGSNSHLSVVHYFSALRFPGRWAGFAIPP